jgi:hypothetical protein
MPRGDASECASPLLVMADPMFLAQRERIVDLADEESLAADLRLEGIGRDRRTKAKTLGHLHAKVRVQHDAQDAIHAEPRVPDSRVVHLPVVRARLSSACASRNGFQISPSTRS